MALASGGGQGLRRNKTNLDINNMCSGVVIVVESWERVAIKF